MPSEKWRPFCLSLSVSTLITGINSRQILIQNTWKSIPKCHINGLMQERLTPLLTHWSYVFFCIKPPICYELLATCTSSFVIMAKSLSRRLLTAHPTLGHQAHVWGHKVGQGSCYQGQGSEWYTWGPIKWLSLTASDAKKKKKKSHIKILNHTIYMTKWPKIQPMQNSKSTLESLSKLMINEDFQEL